MRSSVAVLAIVAATALAARSTLAETHSLAVTPPQRATPPSAFKLGTATSPNGPAITVDGQSLLENGSPVIPVMGEIHYSRTNPAEWRDSLLKMKAGGITVIATYVFWNHHEETEGRWDWTGSRNLRQFLETCKELRLPVIVRMGPWCHGEVRNGGLPDWLLAKRLRNRSTDPAFMQEVRKLYTQIAQQMNGLLYKDGGPIIGVQFDNEYRGPAAYLLALKGMARELGIDTPIYTRTGWPNLSTPMPFGEILPLYSGYAEGFWDRELTPMPGSYWEAFIFAPERTDTAVANEQLGNRDRVDEAQAAQYPYLTCELGGGMMPSYHRRIHIRSIDVYSIPLVKVGSGSNLPGYYMYHGGTNPDAATPGMYLQEHQGTQITNYNDMPAKTYDFQAPLGEFGQVRESYHLLRRTHLFLRDWQQILAPMPPTFPARKVTKSDSSTLRYAVRSDGRSGFVFINNYQREFDMPAKPDTQFKLTLPGKGGSSDKPETLQVPATPFTVPANATFFMPFNLDFHGSTLVSASAEPVCQITDNDTTTVIFSEIPTIPAEFTFRDNTSVTAAQGDVKRADGQIHVANVKPSLQPAMTLRSGNHTTHFLFVDHETSLRVWRATLAGKERILITQPHQTLFTDGKSLTLQTTAGEGSFDVQAIPPLAGMNLPQAINAQPLPRVSIQQTQQHGAPRKIAMGVNKVATAPTDDDFAGQAPAVYQIRLPEGIDPKRRLLLKVNYIGDVARFYLGDKLLTDNFYNGTPFELDLTSWGPDALRQPLTLKILPLQKGAPIYIQKNDLPKFGDKPAVADVRSAELVETQTLNLVLP
jgi:hypothetical protein